jgi:glycosyltransferase involved in cell wall biosynthesis
MPSLVFLGGEDVSARLEISKKFIALDYDLLIIGTEDEEKFSANNIPYQRYAFNREFSIANDIKTIFELRRILKEKESGAIIHAFDTKPTVFLPIAAVGLNKIKVVRTITGMGRIFTENSFKNKVLRIIYDAIQKLVSKRVDYTIFQNDDDQEYFISHHLVSTDKSSVIKSSGLDLSKIGQEISASKIEQLKNELSLNLNEKTFILVSRIVKQKGILNYLEAAKMCYENGHKYNFLLVGQLDTDESIKKEQLDEYKQYVNYLGRREDVKELLSMADIFVLPTYYREGVPRVLLEASAMGLGLITTNMPGCKDVVTDEYNGKLVNIKDSQDLYEKMRYIAGNEMLLKQYGSHAKEKVKEFDLDVVTKKYHDVYQGL